MSTVLNASLTPKDAAKIMQEWLPTGPPPLGAPLYGSTVLHRAAKGAGPPRYLIRGQGAPHYRLIEVEVIRWCRAVLCVAAEASRTSQPQKRRARSVVAIEIACGRLVPQPCERCGVGPRRINGRNRIEGHHHRGYAMDCALDVEWLCRPCHCSIHHAVALTKISQLVAAMEKS